MLRFLALSLLPTVFAQFSQSGLSNVTTAFNSSHIVPDVIPVFHPPDLLDVVFNSVNVTPGALLTKADTSSEPKFFLSPNATLLPIRRTETFVIAIVDPDAPTPQNASSAQYLHFLGGDFTVASRSTTFPQLSSSSPALLDYAPPSPPAGSDPHRYVVAIYKQPYDFKTTAPPFVNSSTPRANFNLTNFANSVGFGIPIAANYFLVGPDNSTTPTNTASISGPTITGSGASGATPTSPSGSSNGSSAPSAGAGGNAAIRNERSILGLVILQIAVILSLF